MDHFVVLNYLDLYFDDDIVYDRHVYQISDKK